MKFNNRSPWCLGWYGCLTQLSSSSQSSECVSFAAVFVGTETGVHLLARVSNPAVPFPVLDGDPEP
jgi:hypothetical protein